MCEIVERKRLHPNLYAVDHPEASIGSHAGIMASGI